MAGGYSFIRQNSVGGGSSCGSVGEDRLVLRDVCSYSGLADNSSSPASKFTNFSEEFNAVNRTYILRCVTNHIFDNILPNFKELTTQQIVLELWTLVPNDIAQIVRTSAGTWSKDSIIKAFQLAESSQNGFSDNTLELLINFEKNETFRNLVVSYIQKTFKGHIVSAETYGSNSNVPPAQIEICNHPTDSIPSMKGKAYLSLPVNHATIVGDNKCTASLCFTRPCIAVLLTCLSVAVISCCGTYLIVRQSYNSVQRSQSQSNRTALSPNTGTIPFAKIQMPPCYNITVTTYKEYNDIMSKLLYDREVNLTIKVIREEDWPINVPLEYTNSITMLECNLGTPKLLNVLRQTRNIQSLNIVGTKFVCGAIENVKMPNRKIMLPTVRHLSFIDLSECSNFYRELSRLLIMKNLESFTLSNGVITVSNSPSIQKLIQNARNSVSSIEFPGTRWMTSILNSKLGTLEQVRSIRIDFLENSGKDILYINRHLDNLLPNLNVFLSERGYISWNQFLNMSDCKNLKHISVGVVIPKVQKSVNIFTLHDIYPLLRSLDISFKFENTENTDACVINGIKEMEKVLRDFSYRSNCYDTVEHERIQKLLKAATDSGEIACDLYTD